MTRPYDHHVKSAQGAGLLGAPTRTPEPRPNGQTVMLKLDEQGVMRPAPPFTGWRTSRAPDEQIQGAELRKGYGPYSNWQLYTPRKSFERNYGPELTEKLRQNARAYQEANPEAMARYGDSSFIPDYSLQHFNRPTWVRQGDSPVFMGAWAFPPAPALSPLMDLGAIVNPEVHMDLGTEVYGTFDDPTPRYDSVLQHEFTHRLQPQLRSSQGGGAQRLMPGEDPKLARASQKEYNAALPYSRFPVELAPMVSEAKLEFYRNMKGLESGAPLTEPEVPVMDYYDPASWQEWGGRISERAAAQEEIYSNAIREGKSPEEARRQVLDARSLLDARERNNIERKQRHTDRLNARRQDAYAGALAHNEYLRGIRDGLPANVGEAMNFNDPKNYQRFLDWMESGYKGENAKDVDWILKLPPEERDLYFKGIVSNQPYSQYRA